MTAAITFSSLFAAFLTAHMLGDHWFQTSRVPGDTSLTDTPTF